MNDQSLANTPLSRATHPNVMTCECQGKAYGISLIPWDSRIRLETPSADSETSPEILGIITISDQLVPIIDLRADSPRTPPARELETGLLVISMDGNPASPMSLGLLVNLRAGQFDFPTNLIRNLARDN